MVHATPAQHHKPSMTTHLRVRQLVESIRCLKHNWLDGAAFSVSFANGYYRVVTSENVHLRFRHNPYLGFYQVTAGYLRRAAWSIQPGMCVVDAGACDGEFALYASRCVGPTGRVVALEPDPGNFRRLCDTFALNGGVPTNVSLLPVGLWKQSGRLQFIAGRHLTSSLTDSFDASSAPSRSGGVIVDALVCLI